MQLNPNLEVHAFYPKKIKVAEAIMKTRVTLSKERTGDLLMKTRNEVDSLGEKWIPEKAYYGIQTLRATENFSSEWNQSPTPFH